MNVVTEPSAAVGTDPRRALFANANFRWLLGGGFLSMLGDQFTLLALPWLAPAAPRRPPGPPATPSPTR